MTLPSVMHVGLLHFHTLDTRFLQISVGGKTTSLGDHDLEEDAARTFDLATLNRQGTSAKLNFPVQDYSAFIPVLTSCSWVEAVSMLR